MAATGIKTCRSGRKALTADRPQKADQVAALTQLFG
jgi:hypothetical protein